MWRVDRVYVDAAGGPWISSQEAVGGTGNIWDAPETWHRSAEPKALVQLLGPLGLLAGTSGAAPGEATTPVTAPSAQQDASGGSRDAGQGNGGGSAADGSAGTGGTADGFSPLLAGPARPGRGRTCRRCRVCRAGPPGGEPGGGGRTTTSNQRPATTSWASGGALTRR